VGDLHWDNTERAGPRPEDRLGGRYGDAPVPRPSARSGCSCLALGLLFGCAVLTALGYVWLRAPYFRGIPETRLGLLFGALFIMFAVPAGIVAWGLWRWLARPSGERRRAVAVAVALVLLAGLIIDWAPWDALKTYYVADTAGVVASTQFGPTGVEHVVLEDGRTIDVWVDGRDGQPADPGWHVTLQGYEQRDGVGVGELLLAGDSPHPWFTTNGSGSCPGRDGYAMRATGGTERADTVDLYSGLRLPKASDYDAGAPEGPFGGWPCLNAQGQVISIMDFY
jgi:hypothetical protein